MAKPPAVQADMQAPWAMEHATPATILDEAIQDAYVALQAV